MKNNNLKAKMKNELEVKAMKSYIKRQEEEYIRNFIDNREEIKNIYAKALAGSFITPKEGLMLIYGFNLNDNLINKCNNKNSL